MEMPSQEEQMIAECYVLERTLERPDTDISKVIKCVCLYVGVTFLIAFFTLHLFQWLGVSIFPQIISNYKDAHPTLFLLFYFLCAYILSGICVLKTAIIGVIKLYQHYAPEEIRRRCLFKPTCSEYAILALKKYGVIIGLVTIYIRLFKKCRGNIYSIDYP